MNELYEKTITDSQGRVYHYDPDQDIYYRRYQPLTGWDRWGWIYVTLVLGGIVLAIELFR